MPVATITRQNIKEIIGNMADRPAAANNLLDRLRLLMRFALDGGWRTDDPTFRVRGFRLKGEGFHTWTEEEIKAFEKRHPQGSMARLAFALMLYTGSRRSDVVRLGWEHIEGENARIRVRQQKTGAFLSIPIHSHFKQELEFVPRDRLTFRPGNECAAADHNGNKNWLTSKLVSQNHGLTH